MTFKEDIEKAINKWIFENCYDMPTTERMVFSKKAGLFMSDFTTQLILEYLSVWESAYPDDESGDYRGGYDDCYYNIKKYLKAYIEGEEEK